MADLGSLYTALNNIAQNLGKLITQTALQIIVPITQGGTGATTANAARVNLGIVVGTAAPNHLAVFDTATSFQDGGLGGSYQVGALSGADMDITTDQPIAITLPPGTGNYLIDMAVASGASVSLTTAHGGIYTGPGKTGLQVVPSSQTYSGLTAAGINTAGSGLVLTVDQTAVLNLAVLYLSLTTPQGVAATADFRIYAKLLF